MKLIGANQRHGKLQRGTSLIEVLVSILILAVGGLGAAVLQLNGLKYNGTAMLRSQATFFAYQITDSMRANRTAALSSAHPYNVAISFTKPTGTTIDKVDLQNWYDALATLPLGTGSINVVGNQATITVQWDESRLRSLTTTNYQAQSTQIQQFVFQTEL